MRARHLNSSAQALYRVFVFPALSHSTPGLASALFPSQTSLRPSPLERPFSTLPSRQAKTRPPEIRTQKWDEEITSHLIYLVDEETNRLSEQPHTRYDVLNRIDRNTHRLVQVADDANTAEENGEEDSLGLGTSYQPFGQEKPQENIPVCKIVSKKDYHKQQEKRKADAKEKRRASALTSSVKTLELNWAIDANDLSHRLNRAQEFLAEGRKVEIVLAAKKRGRKASPEECQGVLKRIRGVVGGVDGAKEERPMEGKLGGFSTLYFAGRPQRTALKESGANT